LLEPTAPIGRRRHVTLRPTKWPKVFRHHRAGAQSLEPIGARLSAVNRDVA